VTGWGGEERGKREERRAKQKRKGKKRRTLVEVTQALARVAVGFGEPLVLHEALDLVERLNTLLRRSFVDERVLQVGDGRLVLLRDGFDGGGDRGRRSDGGTLLSQCVLGGFCLEDGLVVERHNPDEAREDLVKGAKDGGGNFRAGEVLVVLL
jgi:hypothetical protein